MGGWVTGLVEPHAAPAQPSNPSAVVMTGLVPVTHAGPTERDAGRLPETVSRRDSALGGTNAGRFSSAWVTGTSPVMTR